MAVNLNILHKVHRRLNNNQHHFSGGLCYLCGTQLDIREALLCADCGNGLPSNTGACPVCATPGKGGIICATCLQSQKQPIKQIFCAYRYEYPVSQLIQHMKFNSRLDIAAYFGKKLASLAIQQNTDRPDCIVPVPLHPSRLRERGFNQSLELARIVANETGVPVDYMICDRLLNTATQTGLSARQRRRNIKGAFKVNKNACSQYRHVTIFDDVVTTGSTVNELARALGKAGITQIDVWACARASFV
jgi:ComF family protein